MPRAWQHHFAGLGCHLLLRADLGIRKTMTIARTGNTRDIVFFPLFSYTKPSNVFPFQGVLRPMRVKKEGREKTLFFSSVSLFGRGPSSNVDQKKQTQYSLERTGRSKRGQSKSRRCAAVSLIWFVIVAKNHGNFNDTIWLKSRRLNGVPFFLNQLVNGSMLIFRRILLLIKGTLSENGVSHCLEWYYM